jgi:hypothetical protein
VSDTSTTKSTATSTTAKKRTAKKTTPIKRTAKAAGGSTRKSSTATPSSPRAETIETTAGARYLTAVASHTAEQAAEWDAAGKALAEELREVQNRAAGRLPRDTYAQRLAAASPTDVASLLQVHLGYLEDVSSVSDAFNAGYEKAITQYTKRVEALWEGGRKRAAEDFAGYVDELRTELTAAAETADPDALATLGASLIAMSQLAGAVRPR